MDDLRRIFEGRDVVLAAGVVQARVWYVTKLRDLGARRIVVIGSMGTGPLPDADELVIVDLRATDAVDEFRHWEHIAADPPADVRDALDRHPDALVLLNGYEAMTTFGGRPAFGARPAAWTALEDKTTVDALWDELGVRRPPSVVVPVAEAGGQRGVWSGDASQGFNGGGIYVHWVQGDDDERAAIDFFSPRCERVRIAPFVEGIPCSIHGFVTTDGVCVLRPVELLTLRATRPPWFRMTGCATVWDPQPEDREEMRSIARRVGAALRDRVDYRGLFTIDGIMGDDGWVPTELNTRSGAGIVQLRRGPSALAVPLLHLCAIEGVVDPDAAVMEAELLPIVDANRTANAHLVIDSRRVTDEESFERDGVTVILGPAPAGAIVQVKADDVPPVGASFAPLVADALRWADERWDLGVGPLTPARSVR